MVDVIIVVLLLSMLARGRDLGLIRQACSTVGFFGGLFLGAWLQPHVVRLAHTPLSRSLLTLATTLGCALLLLALSEQLGVKLKNKVLHHKLNVADVWLGAGAAGITLLLTVWLSAPVLQSLPFPSLQQAMRNSRIVASLDRSLPKAPNVIADLGHVIYPNGFPQVFAGLEPTPPANVSLPNLGSLTTAVQTDQASVVKIEGCGCGGIVQGSGFVAAAGLVITNAHVVAGVAQPLVLDSNGIHQATPIWFDPDLDLAVLRVNNLAGHVLHLNTQTAANGTAGAVLGYPGGGNFTADPAAILAAFHASGRNIYNQGLISREVYEVKATIIPGNSGGPLIAKDGSVIGVVFAESTTYNQVGYALTMQQVAAELHQAQAANTPVGTGSCAE